MLAWFILSVQKSVTIPQCFPPRVSPFPTDRLLMNIEYPCYWSASINPGQITTWYVNSKPGRRMKFNFDYLPETIDTISKKPVNLINNAHNGLLSKQAVKKIRRAIDYTVYLSDRHTKKIDHRDKQYNFCLNFITCTLSSAQVHTDQEIKKHIFQPLLNYFRQHYHVKNYVWVIEKQKNGNTHFHVISDKWIPWSELRNKWNEYQQNLGYITRYSTAQKVWHAAGFQVRHDLLKTWSYSKQYTAWLAGCRNDWSTPNSTDVHSLVKIHNVRYYITKYVTKNQSKDSKSFAFTPGSIEESLEEDQSFKTITGRIWGCSESLSKIKGAIIENDSDFPSDMYNMKNDTSIFKIETPFYTVHYVTIKQLKQRGFNSLVTLFDSFCIARFPGYTPQLFLSS